MLVRDVMNRTPHYCTVHQRASEAAHEMWKYAIGCVPVVDEDRIPLGMITDRDLCLRSNLQNRRLDELSVQDVMSTGAFTCKLTDVLATAERIMRDWSVRRLPVVDDDDKLVGLLSLDDIVLAGQGSWPSRLTTRLSSHVHRTVTALAKRVVRRSTRAGASRRGAQS